MIMGLIASSFPSRCQTQKGSRVAPVREKPTPGHYTCRVLPLLPIWQPSGPILFTHARRRCAKLQKAWARRVPGLPALPAPGTQPLGYTEHRNLTTL